MLRKLLTVCCMVTTCLVAVGVAQDQDSLFDPDLIIWWQLDETSGTVAADSSGHRTHGLLRHGPAWVPGVKDGALRLDGRNDYVAISGVYYGLTHNADVTVAAWIRTTNGDDQVIFSFDRDEYWRLEINGSAAGAGQIGWSLMTDAGQADLASRTRVDDGQWHHITGLFDRGQVSIYIDGNLDASVRRGNDFGTGRPRFGFVGVGSEASSFDGEKTPEAYFEGEVDDVRLYTRALSPAEVKELAGQVSNNDDCRDAQPVGEVIDLPFDTTEATHDGPGLAIRSPNLWYRYTAACTGVATVSLCGSQFDTILAAYVGGECDPDSGRLIDYNDDACDLQSELTFDVLAGEVYLIEVGGYGQKTGQGVLTIVCEATSLPEFDLGDAPDSAGDQKSPMTAYSSGPHGPVDAHFPTVFQDPAGRAAGPLHLAPSAVAHLGEAVTLETEADTGGDEDGLNNIDPASDKADQDGADDGVILPVAMPQCGWTRFDYLVNVIAPETDLWVNVWCDFNRDGDWDDDAITDPAMVCGDRSVSEWAVQNQLLFGLSAGLHQITTPAFMAWHPDKGPEKIWMRITLSERPWKGGENPGVLGNGGSGPTDGYEIGETEDYFFVPESACAFCQDLNGDGKLAFDDLIQLMHTWLDCCLD
ncbi:MAG: LamG domain-containing protein [Sedimentisphaerales bacterium]|nr:LamG domain-containing protein [Sedimentisphaerales bacterium]